MQCQICKAQIPENSNRCINCEKTSIQNQAPQGQPAQQQNFGQPNQQPNFGQPNQQQNFGQPAQQPKAPTPTPVASSASVQSNTNIMIPAVLGVVALIFIAFMLFSGDFKVKNGVLIEYKGSDSVVMLPNKVERVASSAFDNVKQEITSIKTENNRFVILETGVYKKVTEYKDFVVNSYGIITYTGNDEIVTIPPFITDIFDASFLGNETITTVNIGNHVTEIGVSAFEGCTNLETVNITGPVTSIQQNAFFGNSKLKTVNLPNTLENIDNTAFYMNKELENIVLPNSVKYIGDYAFSYCTKLSNIQIGNAVSTIGHEALSNTPWYDSLNNDEFHIVGDGVLIKYNGDYKDLKIPTNIKSIYDIDFRDEIAENNRDLEWYIVNDTILVAYNGTSENPVIPDNIKEIGMGAFLFNETIETITIPNSVDRISSAAFTLMPYLKTVNISNNVSYIGYSNFFICPELVEVNIPTSLREINDYCFSSCESLTKITIPSNVLSISPYSFIGSLNITEIVSDHPNWISQIETNAKINDNDYINSLISSNTTPDFFEGTGKIDGVIYDDYGVNIYHAKHAIDYLFSEIQYVAKAYGNGDFNYYVEYGELYITFPKSNYIFYLGKAPTSLKPGDFLKLNGDEFIYDVGGLTQDAINRLKAYEDSMYHFSFQEAVSIANSAIKHISNKAFLNEGWVDQGETLDAYDSYFPSVTVLVHGSGNYDVITHVVYVDISNGDFYIENYS